MQESNTSKKTSTFKPVVNSASVEVRNKVVSNAFNFDRSQTKTSKYSNFIEALKHSHLPNLDQRYIINFIIGQFKKLTKDKLRRLDKDYEDSLFDKL